MKVGDFRHRITIVPKVAASDSQGGATTTDGTGVTVWCKAKQLSGERLALYQQSGKEIIYEFTMRHRTIASNYTIQYKSLDFRVNEVLNPDERSEYIVIIATAYKGG